MAEINYKFYDNKDIYDDGSVEEKLLNAYKNKKKIKLNEDGVFYLTTDVRSNIINWFPFQKTDEVLEIGCGCGTITGTLCDKCKMVYSVEGSKRRSEITYYRHQTKKNLKIFVGNFDKIVFNKKFDYVILIGVFEYAKMFFDVDKPFDYFLEKIKNLLKPNGKVLLAIENRYGIKYWAGCNEDHLYQPYIGLESYEDTKIQTFGKKEFIDLLIKHDFVNYKFYYPFPDYKLPSIIYSDSRLPKKDEIAKLPIYLYGGTENFDIHKTLSGLLDNQLFDIFSNSFFIEFGLKDAKLCDITYARILSYRNLDYKTITLENKNHEIIKIGANNKVNDHLNRLVNIHEKLQNQDISTCKINKTGDAYYMDYIEGKSVGEYILDLSKIGDWNMVTKEIDRLVTYYYSVSDFKNITHPAYKGFSKIYDQKTYVLKVPIIDGNASNIIIDKNDNYILIDQEWEASGELPCEYLIYFSLLYIYDINFKLANAIPMKKFLQKYHITDEKIKIFRDYDNYYFNRENQVVDIPKKKNLDSCLASSGGFNGIIYSVLYYDLGNDFSEETKIIEAYQKQEDNVYTVHFSLPKNVKRVRFDPQIGGNKFVYFDKITVNGKQIQYDEYNIFKFKDKNTLLDTYPFIIFPFEKEELTIQIEFQNFKLDEKNGFLQENIKNNLEKDSKIKLLDQENGELVKKLNDIQRHEDSKIINRIKKKVKGSLRRKHEKN